MTKPVNVKDVARDFKAFVRLVWEFLGLPKPTPVQLQICDWLQYGPRRQITAAFRGVGKSWLTSCYVVWRLMSDRQLNFLIVSASSTRSNDFSTFTKRLITELPLLKGMKPSEDERWSNIAFEVHGAKASHQPSVKSMGVMGMLTGSRADVIIADDVEVPNNSATPDLRDKLLKVVISEFESILKPGGSIKFLGTPQSAKSIYNRLREKKYEMRIWPVMVPSPEDIVVYPANTNGEPTLAPGILKAYELGYHHAPTDPDRFNEIEVQERKDRFSRSDFALQFMINTSLSDHMKFPLKLSDLQVLDCSGDKAPISISYSTQKDCLEKDIPLIGLEGDRWYHPFRVDDTWEPFEGSVMFIDPSGKGDNETAAVVVKQLHGYLFVTASVGFIGGYSDLTLIKLAKLARDQKVNRVLIESNYGDGMFTKIFTPILARYHKVTIEDVRNHTVKESRIIDTLEPVMNRHRLIVDRQMVLDDIESAFNMDTEKGITYSMFYQMTNITHDRGSLKIDDRLDALAGAVAYWVNAMARDEMKAVDQYKDRKFDERMKTWMKNSKILHGHRKGNSNRKSYSIKIR